MAGHNKWSKVKHIKAKGDAKKGKAFSKVGRDITIAARQGGANPDMNPALRLAIQKARDVNMPKDNIQRAIEKGAGTGDGNDLEEIIYEAYAPGGVAILIRALTDNKNRTVPNVRAALSKAGGSLASTGAVSYLFEKKGVILFDDGCDPDKVMELAIDAGADDVQIQPDGSVEVTTLTDDFENVVDSFNRNACTYLNADVEMLPQTRIMLDLEKAKGFLKLIDKLEDDDDIQDVFHNADVPDEALEF
ncbi:MAG: YebC/PmpR family DNA-binding transcriptional regulator [Candidatus Margulisiibacteriota bacterium]|nr:YebC/PmpR family DNA-binding transcriptional regulator [Candidatus Margulisiibacteriota bacterium]